LAARHFLVLPSAGGHSNLVPTGGRAGNLPVLLRASVRLGRTLHLPWLALRYQWQNFRTKNIFKNKYTKVCVYQKEGLFLYSQMRGQLNKNR
jgi:hypothetical protein